MTWVILVLGTTAGLIELNDRALMGVLLAVSMGLCEIQWRTINVIIIIVKFKNLLFSSLST